MPAEAYIPFLIAGMLLTGKSLLLAGLLGCQLIISPFRTTTLTGCSNSLWTKWQDMQCVENCGPLDDPTTRVYYEQPVWQTLQMFVGEVGCTSSLPYTTVSHLTPTIIVGFIPVLFTYLRNRNTAAPLLSNDDPDAAKPTGSKLTGSKIFLFWLPAACDLAGTTVSSSFIRAVTAPIERPCVSS